MFVPFICVRCVRSLFILFGVLHSLFAVHIERERERERINPSEYGEMKHICWIRVIHVDSTCQANESQFQSILSDFHFHRALALIWVFSQTNIRILNFYFEMMAPTLSKERKVSKREEQGTYYKTHNIFSIIHINPNNLQRKKSEPTRKFRHWKHMGGERERERWRCVCPTCLLMKNKQQRIK